MTDTNTVAALLAADNPELAALSRGFVVAKHVAIPCQERPVLLLSRRTMADIARDLFSQVPPSN